MSESQEELMARYAREDDEAVDSAVKHLLSISNGRKYLWRLLELGKVGAQPFNNDPHITAFNCGELNVGQQILNHMLMVDPKSYGMLQEEKVNEHRIRTAAIGRASSDNPY